MNRFHLHFVVADLAASVRFHSALFASEPTALACMPDVAAMKPKTVAGAACCAPDAACC